MVVLLAQAGCGLPLCDGRRMIARIGVVLFSFLLGRDCQWRYLYPPMPEGEAAGLEGGRECAGYVMQPTGTRSTGSSKAIWSPRCAATRSRVMRRRRHAGRC